jgi:PAS domain S-box-containing protein
LTPNDDERRAAGEGESGKPLDRYVDTLEDVLFVVDGGGRLRYWNETLASVTGYDDDELADRQATSFFRPADHERVAGSIAEVLETGSGRLVVDLVGADGSATPYEFRGQLLPGEGDVVVGIGRDIGEQQRRERALTALHDVARDLADCDTVAEVCERTIAASREILEFHLSVINIAREGKLAIEAISDDIPPDGAVPMDVDEGLAGHTYQTKESVLLDDVREHPNANPQGPYRAAISLPLGDQGVFQAVDTDPGTFGADDLELAELLVSHAASALARIDYERELERQNERLDRFASVVSHDLRNPLNVATGHLGEARERHGDDPDLDTVAASLDRMEALVDDLLALARVGERPTDPQTVALDDVVERCWGNVATGDVTLTVDTGIAFEADEGALAQLLENLLRNAVEHGSTGSENAERSGDVAEQNSAGSRTESDDTVEHASTNPRSQARGDAVEHGGDGVTVTVGDLDDGAGFFVADDGPGIPADERERVFEDGYSTNDGGTGFGLAIVREVAEAHSWEVTAVESDAGGARFEVRGVEPAG